MTFTFTTPDTARQQKIERLKPLIALINTAIVRKEGKPFSIACAEVDEADVTALIPLLNESGWNPRRVSINDSDKFAGDTWAFELTEEQPAEGTSKTLIFTTPAEARKGRDARLKTTF